MDEAQGTPPGGGIDVARLDKLASRVAAALVLGGLVGFLVVTGDPAPIELAVGLLGIFVVAKLVVLVVGLKQKWPAWPAVVLELLAFVAVGRVVMIGSMTTETKLLVVAVVALLGGAALVRRRNVIAEE